MILDFLIHELAARNVSCCGERPKRHEPAVISEREHHAHGATNLSRFEAYRIDGACGGSPYTSEVNNAVLKQDIQNTRGKDTSEAAALENESDVGLVRGVGLMCDVGLMHDVWFVHGVGLTRNTHGVCIIYAVRNLLLQCRIHKIVLLATHLHKTSEFCFTEVYPHARRDA